VAGSAKLQHTALDGSKLLDGEGKGLDTVLELLAAPEDHDDYWLQLKESRRGWISNKQTSQGQGLRDRTHTNTHKQTKFV
jgi:hypothetical protein